MSDAPTPGRRDPRDNPAHATGYGAESDREADNGSNWLFGGTSDRRWDDQNLDQLKRIPGRAFQVVRSAARPHLC
jgi:hypothetical protein